ncbi:GNAT family N-acetyltransferase [Pelagicoccus sp. NFK12]|uniref:GNAT family N-acetyltransferase n=1 Tax=Pelagicoccus enzymogenes TaxID=2773457 RepID=A0A927IH24_9BACT|nr:GNAT family protein [Pelagicoccus enzymogenes]MBD5779278.1 GNAT family N-acetyltransferase [Pelagicoccus enzymogenes]MDQ8198370.1 GNAT family protein [Pelagicoccus enzymogenes]
MDSVPLDYRIETPRLVLRMSAKEETDFVWDATRHPGFNDGMLWNMPESKEELDEFVGNVPERWLSGDGYLFTFRDKAKDEPLGRIVLERRCGGWNAGFWTHPRYQGAGYATEALGGVLEFAFEGLGLKAVGACHAEWNVASRAVLERNGFRFKLRIEEGFEKDGEWIAQDSLSINRDQWLALRQASASNR